MFSLESLSPGRAAKDAISNIHPETTFDCEIASNSKSKLMNLCDQADTTLTPNMPILRACDALESTKSQIPQTPFKRKSQAEQKKTYPLLQDYQHLEVWI
jgi:hypothetical protein